MIPVHNIRKFDFETVPVDSFWNTGEEKELKIHRIHAYPAKFPAFITTKALEFAASEGYHIHSMADVFCGCGTTAFEARRNGIDFWGCDLNPVATLIAKTKSRKYQKKRLESYLSTILVQFVSEPSPNYYFYASERLKYWYKEKQYNDLQHLKNLILETINAQSDYRRFFLCAFSNILKSTSVWLTKSIKPQVDPQKRPADVLTAFKEQCSYMIKANDEAGELLGSPPQIITANYLASKIDPPKVDMIVTSPPYVTSYEYADLHQLSSLWLGYANDYRELREGSIGSLYHTYNFEREWKRLNRTGDKVVSTLLNLDKAIARTVAKYFLDMQNVAEKAYGMLNAEGLALFVIGNTEYKGVRIDNAKHLAESLHNAGFDKISATKRKISKKILTPYRDEFGQFSTDATGRKVYSEEFILIGRK